MADPMTPSELHARAATVLAIPLQAALNARPIDPQQPSAGLEFPVAGLAINPGGTLHAGALGAILELAGLLALLPALTSTEHAVTHHIATQILSPGRQDDLVRVTAALERRATLSPPRSASEPVRSVPAPEVFPARETKWRPDRFA